MSLKISYFTDFANINVNQTLPTRYLTAVQEHASRFTLNLILLEELYVKFSSYVS